MPKIVGYFEKAQIKDKKNLKEWAVKTKGHPRTFTCKGVLIELENGDEYGAVFTLVPQYYPQAVGSVTGLVGHYGLENERSRTLNCAV